MMLKDKRIFIVEDNVHNRLLYMMILQVNHGAHIRMERNGRELVSDLKSFAPIDLIMLDLMFLLGHPSGYDMIEQLRANPQLSQVPVVAVSAAEPAQALAATKQMGFSGFIAKPINDELFPEQIARLINGEQVWYIGNA